MASKTVETHFVDTHYGKNYVKLLQLRKDGNIHYIKEVEVNTSLTLNNQRDYLYGDNSDIIATDSQKNTVYILAKKYGIETAEQFALLLSNHFLTKYGHVTSTRIYVEEAPWRRIQVNGEKHVHAFVSEGDCTKFAEVTQARGGKPLMKAGLTGLRILKSTQSAFVDFVSDEYRTLPDAKDRLFCTVVEANWTYHTLDSLNYSQAWDGVKSAILDVFAGPADKGIYSPSVQNTAYLAEKEALARIPQIDTIQITMPNVHYFEVDFKRFPRLDFTGCDNQIFMTTDKPSGIISVKIQRNHLSKL